MKRGIISKALTGTMVLLLAGGCNTVYEWWDFSSESRPQEPVVSANPPAAEPPPPANPDAVPAVTHPVPGISAESVAAPGVAAVPEPKPLPPASAPVLVNPEGKEDPGLAQAGEAEEALARAKERLDWATGIGAKSQFPTSYTRASTAYSNAVKARTAQDWEETVRGSQTTVAAVAEIESLLTSLQAKEAEEVLARAKERLDWATGIGAKSQFPASYTKASTAYSNAVKARTAQDWEETVRGSQTTVAVVAEIESLLAALQAREAEDALARAKERLDWATGIGAKSQFPAPYTKASTAYSNTVKAKNAQNWEETVRGSQTTVAAVAEIESLLAALQAKKVEALTQAKEAEEALVRAKERLDWATGIGAKSQFPTPYTKASTAYSNAVKAKNVQNWEETVRGSQTTVAAVAEIESLLAALQAKKAEDALTQAKKAEEALAKAKERLDWATGIGAKSQFPAPYTRASTAYSNAVKAKSTQNWEETVRGSQTTVAAVVEIESLLAALQAQKAEDALTRAKERLDWATGIGAKNQFPAPYTKASTAYSNAVKAKSAQSWEDTLSKAQTTVDVVAEIESLLTALQAGEAEEALARAKERLDWATGIGAKSQFPAPYTKASTAYNTAVKARTAQNWEETVRGSQTTVAAVTEIESLLAALQAREVEEALARAKERLDWATGIGAKSQFPAPYTRASTAYSNAVKARTAQNWEETVRGSQTTVAAVAEIESLLAALQAKKVEDALTQAKEAEEALVRAKERLDWATGIGAKSQFPAPYTRASTAYSNAVKAKNAQNWEETVRGSQTTVVAVAEIESLLAALQVKKSEETLARAKEAEDALARAKERLDWATGIDAKSQFPAPYTRASIAYSNAVKAKTAQNWEDTLSKAQATVAAVAEIESLLAALQAKKVEDALTQAKEAEEALARAKEQLDWATGIGAKSQFPASYTKASTAYSNAVKAKNAQNWEETVRGSQTTVVAVAEIESLLAVLQAREAEDALTRAKERLDWATGIGAKSQFPAPYTKATTAYNIAVKARTAQDWEETVRGSQTTVAAVAEIESLLAALQAKKAEDALTRAKERLDWATGIGAKSQFPAPYTRASTAYSNAVKAKNAQNWEETVRGSQTTVTAVAEIESFLAALQVREAEDALTQAKEAEDALVRAKERLDWATGIGAKSQFPAPYTKASTAYSNAVKAKNVQNWEETVRGSQTTVAAVAEIESLLAALQAREAENLRNAGEANIRFIPPTEPLNPLILMQEYSVKPMGIVSVNMEHPSTGSYIVKSGDSYRTIAEHFYGDVQLWRIVYEANKDRMRNPDNPHLIFPGMALDIPALSPPVPVAGPESIGVSVQIKEKEPEPVSSRPVAIESFRDPEPAIPYILGTVPAAEEYTVKAGDSYWTIAEHFYGDVQLWRIVYEANKDRMRNPDNPHLIFPGMMLRIPGIFNR